MPWGSITCRAFERELAGGGYVAIDVSSKRSIWHGRTYEGRLVIERRATALRRAEHAPPVIAEAAGRSQEAVIQQLLPAAQCNATIGSALLRLELKRQT